jgi:hypothetical protein
MKLKTYMLTTASAVVLATSANAGFVNGGFETGDFTGWDLEHGSNFSGNGTITFTPGSAGSAYIVGPGAQAATRDPYSPFDTAFNGNYMAQLNEFVPVNDAGNYDATRISQTGIMGLNETEIFINWGAVLEDPGHPAAEQPFFLIEVYKNGSLFGSTYNIAGAGWATSGQGPDTAFGSSPAYYSAGQYHLTGLVAGDSVKVQMTVADCGQSGHAGWAYLDGIGTTSVDPPPSVPDGGSTIAMLGLAVGGIGALRRKLKPA